MQCREAIDAPSGPHPFGEFLAQERFDSCERPVEDSRLKHEVKALEPERETALQQTRDKWSSVVPRNPEIIGVNETTENRTCVLKLQKRIRILCTLQ